jgi:hypothetical protein
MPDLTKPDQPGGSLRRGRNIHDSQRCEYRGLSDRGCLEREAGRQPGALATFDRARLGSGFYRDDAVRRITLLGSIELRVCPSLARVAMP